MHTEHHVSIRINQLQSPADLLPEGGGLLLDYVIRVYRFLYGGVRVCIELPGQSVCLTTESKFCAGESWNVSILNLKMIVFMRTGIG